MSIMLAAFAAMGADVTPNAVDWADIAGVDSVANANQTIDGISSSITISIVDSAGSLTNYRIDSGSYILYTAPFTISNGQTLNFRVDAIPFSASVGTITVRNDSAASATLDTFTYEVTSSAVP